MFWKQGSLFPQKSSLIGLISRQLLIIIGELGKNIKKTNFKNDVCLHSDFMKIKLNISYLNEFQYMLNINVSPRFQKEIFHLIWVTFNWMVWILPKSSHHYFDDFLFCLFLPMVLPTTKIIEPKNTSHTFELVFYIALINKVTKSFRITISIYRKNISNKLCKFNLITISLLPFFHFFNDTS